ELEAFAVSAAGWPPPGPPEFAFAGRSNVGKSSLINALTQRRELARVSSTPGKTRGLAFFRVQPAGRPPVRLVDLPGYGFARVSKRERKGWRPLVEEYVIDRPQLRQVVVLVDARRGASAADLELCEWLRSLGRPYLIVLTKIDELPATQRGSVAQLA